MEEEGEVRKEEKMKKNEKYKNTIFYTNTGRNQENLGRDLANEIIYRQRKKIEIHISYIPF